MIYWGYLIGYGYLAMLICIAELLSRHTALSREILRKVLHCLIGMEWLVLYYFFADSWQIVVIPASFILVNALSYRFKFFHSIERDSGNHLGTIYYAVAMTAMSIAVCVNSTLMLPFGISVACLSFGDAAAALMGQYLKPRIAVFSKSLWGVLGCFLFSIIAQLGLFLLLKVDVKLDYIIAIAVVASLSEVLTTKGTDNIFICLWCFVWGYAFYFNNTAIQIVLYCFVGFVLCCVCANTGSFTLSAAVLAGGMLALAGVFGGIFAFLYILCAYGVIYLGEHIIRREKYKETRGTVQIIQNGLCAFVVVFAYYLTGRTFLLLAYVVAISESLTDSFAGLIGNAYGHTAYDLISHRPVERGLSGAVTAIGTIAGLAVSVTSTVFLGFLFGWGWYLVALALLPFGGMIFDSFLGASVQFKRQCIVCGAVCECTSHCSRPTVAHSGHPFFTNGHVNLICNAITTGVALLILYFIY